MEAKYGHKIKLMRHKYNQCNATIMAMTGLDMEANKKRRMAEYVFFRCMIAGYLVSEGVDYSVIGLYMGKERTAVYYYLQIHKHNMKADTARAKFYRSFFGDFMLCVNGTKTGTSYSSDLVRSKIVSVRTKQQRKADERQHALSKRLQPGV